MILNSYIIAYLVCSAMSLFTGTVASFNGFYVWKRWDTNNNAEEQYILEKKVYLIITVLFIGFTLRIFMFPLWFVALHSMIISVPGAMCLVGVHNINAPLSYIASALKIILPAIYGYWLILNILDRKVETQPFMKQKLWLSTPLGIIILIETILDLSFFFSTPPRQVSCCTSLFDVPRNNAVQLVTVSTWLWVYIFYALAVVVIGEIVYFIISQKKNVASDNKWWFCKKGLMLFQTALIIVLFASFILALQTKISPIFLDLPFHHCIFCLCQKYWDVLLSFFMIFSGLCLFLVYFWVISSKNYIYVNCNLSESMVKIILWSLCLFAGGTIILSFHLMIVLLNL